jgi:ribonuclease III
MSNLSDLQKVINVTFKDVGFLENAFIHRSFLNENKEKKLISNERLEFLGDTVVSLIISSYIYKTFTNFTEGELTAIRSAVVNTKSLAAAATTLELGNYLKLSKGEEDSGGRKNSSLLANTFEALTGAIYLDSGLTAAERFLEKSLIPSIEQVLNSKNYKDYKSKLQEKVQEKLKISPVYSLLSSTGPDHAKTFEIAVTVDGRELGKGTGHSKQEAEQEAAKAALEK